MAQVEAHYECSSCFGYQCQPEPTKQKTLECDMSEHVVCSLRYPAHCVLAFLHHHPVTSEIILPSTPSLSTSPACPPTPIHSSTPAPFPAISNSCPTAQAALSWRPTNPLASSFLHGENPLTSFTLPLSLLLFAAYLSRGAFQFSDGRRELNFSEKPTAPNRNRRHRCHRRLRL